MSAKENCRHLLETLSDYIDDQLAPELCAELEKHLSTCQDCRIVVDTLQKTISLFQQTAPQKSDLPQEVKERLFVRLNLESFLKE